MIQRLAIPQSNFPPPATSGDTVSRGPVVTATLRLAREIRGAFDRAQLGAGESVWEAPQVLPVAAWLTGQFREWLYSARPGRRVQLLSASGERAIWEDIIRQSGAGNALLQVPSTADAAFDAWNLAHAWSIPFDAPEWNDTAEVEAFHEWAARFRQCMGDNGWLSNAELPAFLAGCIDAGELEPAEQLQLAGFFELTPAEIGLFDALKRAGCEIQVRSCGPSPEGARVTRLETADRAAEIRSAAAWARRRLEDAVRSGRNDVRIGIVVPDLEVRRSRFERVFLDTFHPDGRLDAEDDPRRLFNISLGPALSEYPPVDAALGILDFDPAANGLEETGRLLRSRFVGGGDDEYTRRALLDRRLRELRKFEVEIDDLIRIASAEDTAYHCPRLVHHLECWRRKRREMPDSRKPSDWAESWSELLETMGWPGDAGPGSVEYQTLTAWSELLSEFAGLDAACGFLSRNRAWNMMVRMSVGRRFQPESDPAPIQILGTFEASGLGFDHLWLAGMDDGAWPPVGGSSPFLPLRLQRRFNLPGSSPGRELEFGRLVTGHLLASAPEVVVSSPANEDDTRLRPSPLVAHLPGSSVAAVGADPGMGSFERLLGSSILETIEDRDGPPWSPSDGRQAGGGASIFEWQAACPFRAFARARLGAGDPVSVGPGLDPLDRGVLVHEVLERVWKQFRSHRDLVSAPPVDVDAIIETTVDAAVEAMARYRATLKRPRFARIERRRLTRLVAGWLELEKARRPFTVLGSESRREVEIGGLRLSIRVDRVDRIEDGTEVIVDYKTGDHGPQEWEGPRPDAPQLPLYAATADAPLAGLFFAVLKPGKIGFRGLAAADDLVPGVGAGEDDPPLVERIAEWREVLEGLAQDFRAGMAAVDPKQGAKTCLHCNLTPLCRISESGRDPASGSRGG